MSIFEIQIRKRGTGDDWSVECIHRLNTSPNHLHGTFRLEKRDELNELADAPKKSEEYGERLGEALFKEDVIRTEFTTAVRNGTDKNPLRVLLYIEDEELKNLRWEKLRFPLEDKSWSFLRFDPRVTFSIYVPSPIDSSRFPPISKLDLRALVLVASPKNVPELHCFDIQKTIDGVQKALQGIDCDVLANDNTDERNAPTLPNLLEKLQEKQYTLLHIVCHGMVTSSKKDTILYWAKANSESEPVLGKQLIKELKNRGYSLPHFTFLCACETASQEEKGVLGGLAGRLVRELGMPAVVAMTDKVEVDTAKTLAEQFYRYLKESGEVDSALAKAVKAVPANHDISDIIVPALFSRLGGLPLFSNSLEKELNDEDIERGLKRLLGDNKKSENKIPNDSSEKKYDSLINKYAPILYEECEKANAELKKTLRIEKSRWQNGVNLNRQAALQKLNNLCREVFSSRDVEFTFNALALDIELPKYDARCPFQGLFSFDLKSKDFFFGREKLIDELKQKLNENNFLAVIGDSGSGKSSVVRAGLIPVLLKEEGKSYLYLTPGQNPLDKLNAQLERNSQPFVLVVDQFEELFTLSNKTERQNFIDRLLELIVPEHKVVITMRVDFWGECANYGEKFRELVEKSKFFILRMTSDELRGAMEKQAEKVGLSFEAGLSKLIWNEVEGEPGAMPLLQHALRELWKRRHGRWLLCDEYEKIGTEKDSGLKGAIAKTAEDFYNNEKLSDEDKEHIKNIFMCLTQVDKHAVQGEPKRDTRRRVTKEDLLTLNERNPNRIWELVTLLADRRLVITTKNTQTEQIEVEVAHEALIRYWPRLQEWLENNRNDLMLRDKIREYAEYWQEHPKKEDFLPLGGEQLEKAENLSKNKSIVLGNLEREYIQACRYWHEQETQNKLEIILDASISNSQLLFTANKRLDALLNLINIGKISCNDLKKYEYSRLRFLVMFGHIFSSLAEYNTINTNDDEVTSITWNPVNQIIASANSQGIIKFWNPDGSFIEAFKGHNGEISDLSFSPDGETLASAGDDGSINIWQKEAQNNGIGITSSSWFCHKLQEHEAGITSISFSPDGKLIISACKKGVIKIWKHEREKSIKTLEEHKATVTCITFSPDGRMIASTDKNGTIKIWLYEYDNVFKLIKSIDKAHNKIITSVNFSHDGKILVSSGRDELIKLWNNKGEEVTHFDPKEKVLYVNFGSDGNLLASSDADGTIKIWAKPNNDWFSQDKVFYGQLFNILKPEKGVQQGIKLQKFIFINDDKKLISCSGKQTIKFWNYFSKFDGHDNENFNGHTDPIYSIDFNTSDKNIATASRDGTIKIWNHDGALLETLSNYKCWYKKVKFSYDGKFIAAINNKDKKSNVIFLKKNGSFAYKNFHNYGDCVTSISFSPVSNICAIAQDKSIVTLNLDDMKCTISTEKHSTPVRAVNFNSKGTMIVSASKDGTVKLWELYDDKLFASFNNDELRDVYHVSFFDDDKIITVNPINIPSQGQFSEIKIWNIDGGLLKSIRSKTKKFICDLKLSQDKKTIVSVAKDCIVEFWNWNLEKNALKIIQLDNHEYSAACFSPDWSAIAVASFETDYQNRIKLWNLNLKEALEEANRYITDYQNSIATEAS
jgi:WD40 repeat protein/ABC-type oligopeptide transport system ATPase subunit